jgi:hypothetical protein
MGQTRDRMNEPKQHQKSDDTQVVSPLVNDKTYGERWYSGVFDWGLNYWTNLLASAGFSQWAENGTRSVSWLGDKSPRIWQADVSKSIRDKDPFMNGKVPFTNIDNPLSFMKGFKHKVYTQRDTKLEQMKHALEGKHTQHHFTVEGSKEELLSKFAEKFTRQAEFEIMERSMARARSLILLMPGFAVVIPTVWLGAKLKPWFVETINRMHYGKEAMDDPTMKARHQAIEAEACPTLLGTVAARMGTVVAAQTAAQLVGSKNNFINKLGKKNRFLANFGVDPVTEKWGEKLGGTMPESFREGFNTLAQGHGLEASEHQVREKLVEMKLMHKHDLEISPGNRAIAKEAIGAYSTASQDLGRFIVADTFYTMVTALTIHPLVKLLRLIPGMSYKPKMPENAAYFRNDSEVRVPTRVKVPANEYGELTDRTETPVSINTPSLSINQAAALGTLHQREHQIA